MIQNQPVSRPHTLPLGSSFRTVCSRKIPYRRCLGRHPLLGLCNSCRIWSGLRCPLRPRPWYSIFWRAPRDFTKSLVQYQPTFLWLKSYLVASVPDITLLPALLELVLVHSKGHIEVLSTEFLEAGVKVDINWAWTLFLGLLSSLIWSLLWNWLLYIDIF